ncbi:uncharacterized protein MYCFIDRAFT_204045 [Pseudocercospora fijiensis CIRAD86]|uniref:Uncharacterized protein n=1 Tax=Pseudocercospora fijiensis (strain CIRAD86) TaxID=383855 RepID=M3ATB1_PSEFD|nr:uncharacterized protein MYCFIDRAFT_204045 [Pseudocercospora fijiensis CIRAD86]EME80712.1 hypothetical protein MYCFIDRAFT_204045 [Pseudocercospora fijiensis CIRAD86]
MRLSTETAALQAVDTAKPPATIWSRVCQDDFRNNLVALEKKTNAVPVDVLSVSVGDTEDHSSHGAALPLAVEKQVADDLAYLAAVTEGAQSVAAVCLEQHISNGPASSLVCRVAGMDVVDMSVRLMLDKICEILQHVSSSPSELHMQDLHGPAMAIFGLIIEQHQQKLLGRLRSQKWSKPAYLARTHKKSLWKDFENVIHRAQHVYPKRSEKMIRTDVQDRWKALAETYQNFEDVADDSQKMLQLLVGSTYDFCQSAAIASFARKLEDVHATPQIAAALKTLRQLEKIGAYWRIAKVLVKTARSYPSLFREISIEYITPYVSVPTEIAHESWAKTCHVHAEVQLAVHYALSTTSDCTIWPRVIGTSKYYCYLCYLFLRYQGKYQALNTHGRLYDQWTVPDLEGYSVEARERFAMVLEAMNSHIAGRLGETTALIWRPEPMTSRQNLLCYQQTASPTEELEDAMQRATISVPLT